MPGLSVYACVHACMCAHLCVAVPPFLCLLCLIYTASELRTRAAPRLSTCTHSLTASLLMFTTVPDQAGRHSTRGGFSGDPASAAARICSHRQGMWAPACQSCHQAAPRFVARPLFSLYAHVSERECGKTGRRPGAGRSPARCFLV